MIESVQFKNYRILRDTTLPLSQFTLIVGPNGSGKSTALMGIKASGSSIGVSAISMSAKQRRDARLEITVRWGRPLNGLVWRHSDQQFISRPGNISPDDAREAHDQCMRMPIYSLDPQKIAEPVQLEPQIELSADGGKLAGVLDRLRDRWPERFDSLNNELGRWLPEFNRILFDTPRQGYRSVLLRTRNGSDPIPAADLSHGTLLALALLTMAYLPNPPALLGLEEPDRGIHPRLLREVRDALYRLSYPENFDENREPVQVITTSHSPYFLDLFRDHPEEVVVAQRVDDNVKFERLTDRPDCEEILQDTPLGDAWYSGILGGVPAHS